MPPQCGLVRQKEIFLKYKTNVLYLAFNHAEESVSSKNAVRLLNETVN